MTTALQGSLSWVVDTPWSDPFLVSYHFHTAFGCASFFHLQQSLMEISITTEIILIHPFSHQHTRWGGQWGAHCVTPQAWPNIFLVLVIGRSLLHHFWCLSLDAPPITLLLSNPWCKWYMAHNSDRWTQKKCYNSIFNDHNQHTASGHQPLAHGSNYHCVTIINSKLMILSFLRYNTVFYVGIILLSTSIQNVKNKKVKVILPVKILKQHWKISIFISK